MNTDGSPCSHNNGSSNDSKKLRRDTRDSSKNNRQINGKLNIFWIIFLIIITTVMIGYIAVYEQSSVKNDYSLVGKTFINLPLALNEDISSLSISYTSDSTLTLIQYWKDWNLRDSIMVNCKIKKDSVFIYANGKPFSAYKIKWIDKYKYEAIIDSTTIEVHVLKGSKYDIQNIK